MTGLFICGCILYPLALLALSVGSGLLVRRLGGGWLPGVLVAPVGFALVVVVCAFATYISWLAPAAGYIALTLAVAGFALEARAGRLTRPRIAAVPWAALAALGAFLAVGSPALLSGTPTWSGYSRIVDIGFQMDFSQYLAEAGRAAAGDASSYLANVEKLVEIGYPGGGQATLGATAALIHTNLAWCYQTYHAFAAAIGALAIYSLLGGVTRRGWLRALGGFVAIQPNVMYAYALEGGIKELTTAVMLVVSGAVLAERAPGEGSLRSVLPAAVAISAAIGAFSFGVAPWLGLVLAALFAITLTRRTRVHALVSWGLLTVTTVVITLPGIVSAATQLAGIAGNAIGGSVNLGLGNLAAPVPDWSAAGVWLTGDYRFPLAHAAATHAFDVVVMVAGAIGIVFALRRRRFTLALLGLAAPIALYYYIEHTSPWIQFKSFTITGVFALTLAFAGVAALCEGARRVLVGVGWLLAATITAAVLYGNAQTYHDTSLAPAARYQDLAAIGQRFAGQGPTLYPAWDEYAEYFLRHADASSFVVPVKDQWRLRPGVLAPGAIAYIFNLNQFQLSFLQEFRLIVTPRGPQSVRAPSNWQLAEQTRYFDVWRRVRPASEVVEHLPLSGLPHERTPLFCANLQKSLRRAGAGAELAYVPAPVQTDVSPAAGAHPNYWVSEGNALVLEGAGSARVHFTLPRAADYEIWVEGTIGRPVKFTIDGHTVGTVAYEERYPSEFLYVGARRLAGGSHTLVIARGGASLHPGAGNDVDPDTRTLATIVLLPRGSQTYQVKRAPASAAAGVCAAPVGYEWMEVVKPSSARPPGAGAARV